MEFNVPFTVLCYQDKSHVHEKSACIGPPKTSHCITCQLAYSYEQKNSQQKHSQVRTRSHCLVSILNSYTSLAYSWQNKLGVQVATIREIKYRSTN